MPYASRSDVSAYVAQAVEVKTTNDGTNVVVVGIWIVTAPLSKLEGHFF